MEEEKVYLNYGDQQVDQAQLLTNMANQVQNYVNQQSWSGKRKQKFMDAYTDLVNKGLRGATNTSGRWQVEVGGDVDVESMDRKDREMYQEAAYFIQQQMQGLATAKQAEEEAKKAEMQKFDFLSGFAKHLNNTMAGGQQLQIGGENDQWNYLDERGTNGLRGINNRANKLADMLQTYSDSLDASKLDFTDTPYQNLDDFKAKVNTAIAALRSGDMNNIRPTLNAIGLNPTEFFYDGSGDQIVGADGNPVTYAQQAQALAAEEAAKAQEAQQQAYLEAQANKGVLNQDNGIHSKEARISPKAYAEFLSNTYGVGETGFNNINARIQKLIEGSYNKGLSAADKKELGNLLYYVRTNNPNYKGLGFGKATNLSDADWAELRTHTNHLSSVTRENFVRLPWKTSDGRITYADNQGNLYFLKPANRKQIADPKFTRSAEYNNYKNNFLSGTNKGTSEQHAKAMNMSLKDLNLGNLPKPVQKELEAILWDFGSIANPEAISGSGMALYAAHLRDEANPDRGLGEKILDYGTGLLGGVQVAGDAALATKSLYKLGKLVTGSVKVAGTIGMGLAAWSGVPAMKDIMVKLATQGWSSITADDIKTFTYGMTTGFMGYKGFKGARNRQQTAKQSNPTIPEHSIQIKDKNGQIHTLKIDSETAKQVNDSYTRLGSKAKGDQKVFENAKIKEQIETYNKKNPNKQIKTEGASIVSSNRYGRVTSKDAVQTKQVVDPNAPQYEPVGTNIYRPGYMWNWQRNLWSQKAPESNSTGLFTKLKEFWNPTPKPINEPTVKPSTETTTATETPKPTTTTSKTKPLTTEEVKELRESLAGKRLSTNPLKSDEAMTVKGFGDVYLMDNKNGTHTLELQLPNGNKFSITSKEADIKQNTAKFLKETLNKININAKSDKDRIKQHISLELIKKLKSVGALKQGGKITDTQIDNFLNQYK